MTDTDQPPKTTVDGLIRKIAAAQLWRDQYPDGPEHDLVSVLFHARDVRFARALLRSRRSLVPAIRPRREPPMPPVKR